MTLKVVVLRACGGLMPDFYRPPASVLLPFGHIVADTAPPHVRHLYGIPSIAKFKSDLEVLCRRCRPLQISELEKLPRMRDTKPSTRHFILSFDDGMREVYDIVAPILRDKGIPAILFINSGTIDNKQLMWRHKVSLLIEQARQQPGRVPPQINLRPGESLPAKLSALRFDDGSIIDGIAKFFDLDFDDYLRRTKPYLTSEHVLELARAGFEVGAHSDSHPCFHEMTLEDQRKQISTSVNFIRALGLPCRCFAFPFHDGGVPASIFQYMADLDLSLSFGTSEARLDSVPFSFQRFALDAGNVDSSISDILRQLSVKSFVRRLSGTEVIRRN
jgi:peptidoglycan/xylan/chitin deacetylase (PgdA/CDA1 family)